MVACCDLSGWIETKLLRIFFSWTIADYLLEDIICRYSYFGKLIIDEESKNKEVVAELAQKYKVKRVIISSYHS